MADRLGDVMLKEGRARERANRRDAAAAASRYGEREMRRFTRDVRVTVVGVVTTIAGSLVLRRMLARRRV